MGGRQNHIPASFPKAEHEMPPLGRCPVMEPCLEWAVDSGQDAGVWGGMSEDERRAYKRRSARVRVRA